MTTNEAIVAMLTEFVQRERAMRDAIVKGGRQVNGCPSINVSALRELEHMIRDAPDVALYYNSCLEDLARVKEERDAFQAQRDYLHDLPLCRQQLPDGTVPGCTEDALRAWHGVAIKKSRELDAMTAQMCVLKADNAMFKTQLYADKLAFEAGTIVMNEGREKVLQLEADRDALAKRWEVLRQWLMDIFDVADTGWDGEPRPNEYMRVEDKMRELEEQR